MSAMDQPGNQPASLLDQCTDIKEAIQELRIKREGQLLAAQNALLDSSTGKEDQAARQTLDYIEDDLNIGFRGLRDSLRRLVNTPGSGDPHVQPQIDKAKRDLQFEINQYQKAQSDFQNRLKEQVRRRYEIANPEATPEELDEGVENALAGQEQTFQVRLNDFFFLGVMERVLIHAVSRLSVPERDKQMMPNELHCSVPRPFARSSEI